MNADAATPSERPWWETEFPNTLSGPTPFVPWWGEPGELDAAAPPPSGAIIVSSPPGCHDALTAAGISAGSLIERVEDLIGERDAAREALAVAEDRVDELIGQRDAAEALSVASLGGGRWAMISIGDFIAKVLSIQDSAEARHFFDEYVAELGPYRPLGDAASVARENIGYCFGEGMTKERRAMWREACEAALGEMVEDLTAQQAFDVGLEAGRSGAFGQAGGGR